MQVVFSRGYVPSMVMSLDHTVRFHDTNYRADEWLLYECYSPWASELRLFFFLHAKQIDALLEYSRAFTDGKMWTQSGRLILSASQESLSRTKGPKSSM